MPACPIVLCLPKPTPRGLHGGDSVSSMNVGNYSLSNVDMVYKKNHLPYSPQSAELVNTVNHDVTHIVTNVPYGSSWCC